MVCLRPIFMVKPQKVAEGLKPQEDFKLEAKEEVPLDWSWTIATQAFKYL